MPRKKIVPLKRNADDFLDNTGETQHSVISSAKSQLLEPSSRGSSKKKMKSTFAPGDVLKVKSVSTARLQKHIKVTERLLAPFNIYIRVYKNTQFTYSIGQILITIHNDFQEDDLEKIYGMYIGDETTMILCVDEKASNNSLEEKYILASSCVPVEILNCLAAKYFAIQYSSSPTSGNIILDVYLTKYNFPTLISPSICPDNTVRSDVKRVIQFFSGNDLSEKQSYRFRNNQDFSRLFDSFVNETPCLADVQHPDLIPNLRPYQQHAVQWMLSREQKQGFYIEEVHGIHHPLFTEYTTLDGIKLYYNKSGGYFSLHQQHAVAACRGGILADEMGLGKTVEVLACILNNPQVDKNLTDESQLAKKVCVRSISSSSNSVFSCCCGETEYADDDLGVVKCHSCGILQHAECFNYIPLQADDVYYCPHCWVEESMELVTSGATLIVSPHRICYQWEDEIRKHVQAKSLKILSYYGLGHHNFIQPRALAQYDIVLTTYEVLRKELNYVDLPYSSRNCALRHPQKYYRPPSPLPAVLWWRICLDEAQMAENATSSTAKMARKLNSVHRWCVTGTPVQKNVNDLYGLLLFIGHDPYCFRIWWKETVYLPFCNGNSEPLLNAFKSVLWRTLKKNVIEQINIPRQDTAIHWVNLSPVEEYFYKEQNRSCMLTMSMYTSAQNLNTELKSMSKDTLNKVWRPVRLLRQACCHPQVVKGQFISPQKAFLSMSQVLDVLIKRAQNTCEDSHRQLFGALNGLAGLSIIAENQDEAVSYYKEAISSAHSHSDRLRTDTLQLYHAFFNIANLIGSKSADSVAGNISSTATPSVACNSTNDNSSQEHPLIREPLSYEKISEEAEKIKSTYLEKTATAINSARDQLRALNQEESEQNKVLNSSNPWWVIVAECAVHCDKDGAFVDKLTSDLQAAVEPGRPSVANQFRGIHGLCLVIEKLMRELRESHNDLKNGLLALPSIPTEDDVISAASCHLRPHAKQHTKFIRCKYCKVQEYFNAYESKLFRCRETTSKTPYKRAQQLKRLHHAEYADEENLADDTHNNLVGTRGTWADSEFEKILKALLVFGRGNQVPADAVEEGNKVLQWMTTLKKEFRAFRNFWMRLCDHVSAVDELNMASQCFRLKLPTDVGGDPSVNYVIEEDQVSTMQQKLKDEKKASESELKECLLKLFYLQNLKNLENERNGKESGNTSVCPVCRQQLRSMWAILTCGHSVCYECFLRLMKVCALPNRPSFFRCPVCRGEICGKDAFYVGKQVEGEFERQYPVQGNFSSKVTAIIRCLLQIREEDPTAKTLVFSEWQDLLNILASGLGQNSIPFVSLWSKKKFQMNLLKFKRDPDVNTALLPVHSCASGLNIIEATHVILSEPLLHPSWELQAIGRVHRIGQTKNTSIHRFIVKDSIEEKVFRLLPSGCQSDEEIQQKESHLTLQDLQQLF